jgi:hypothetical protein
MHFASLLASRSLRPLMEQPDSICCFARCPLSADTMFTNNRDRLQEDYMLPTHGKVNLLLPNERFSVRGTLIQARCKSREGP